MLGVWGSCVIKKKLFIIFYLFFIDFNVGYIVFKDSWDVDFWELVFVEDDEEIGFIISIIFYDY